MPKIADYTTIGRPGEEFILETHSNQNNGIRIQEIDAPHLEAGGRPVLVFRAAPKGRIILQMSLNGKKFLEHKFTTDPQRSWHEVIPVNFLKPSNNELTMSVTTDSPEGGSITVSNLVLFFQANIP